LAKGSRSEPADALEQLQSWGDRLAHWIATNPSTVIGAIAAVLLLTASYGGYAAWSRSTEDAASAALAEVRREYLSAMGRAPGAIETEPANPEISQRVRAETVERYLQVAKEHGGTSAAAIAQLEAGDLRSELGAQAEALALWSEALEGRHATDRLRGMLLERIAATHDAAERWPEAARAYEEAGEIESYPPRHLALASAARCYANAGDTARALSLFEQIEREAPTVSLPPHVAERLAELRIAGSAEEVVPPGGSTSPDP
jgi:tetratricopeptide (TPR) repeat protein